MPKRPISSAQLSLFDMLEDDVAESHELAVSAGEPGEIPSGGLSEVPTPQPDNRHTLTRDVPGGSDEPGLSDGDGRTAAHLTDTTVSPGRRDIDDAPATSGGSRAQSGLGGDPDPGDGARGSRDPGATLDDGSMGRDNSGRVGRVDARGNGGVGGPGAPGSGDEGERPAGQERGLTEDDTARTPLRLSQTVVPSGAVARARTNLSVIRLLNTLDKEARAATADEKALLAQWSGWGACSEVFDSSNTTFSAIRDELHSLVTDADYALAERSVLNAHYTPPEVAHVMWQALSDLGMPHDALVVEPGCGSGNFLGTRPSEVVAIGIERDPLTARIARALYDEDDVTVLQESFADTALPSYDVAVGNVPFGDFPIFDGADRQLSGQSIHNYFITKSLKGVRENGIVMVLTSRYTLDSVSTQTRDLLHSLGGRFLGAVRLPGQTMNRVAGTTVITDILILQRSDLPDVADWMYTEQIGTKKAGDDPIMVNEYFLAHPEAVVGALGITSGPFGDTVGVEYSGSYEALFGEIHDALNKVVASALANTVVVEPKGLGPSYQQRAQLLRKSGPSLPRGSIIRIAPHQYQYAGMGDEAVHKVSKKDEPELDALLAMRDWQQKILTFESLGYDEDRIGDMRLHFEALYDDYVAKYGYLNRQTIKEAKPSPRSKDVGEVPADTSDADIAAEIQEFASITRYVRPTQGGFARDPLAARLFAVESYDAQRGVGTKGAFFTTRVTSLPETPVVATPLDAIAYSMAYTNEIDPLLVANLLEVTRDEAQAMIEENTFFNPATVQWEHPAIYLSGDIYDKLDALPEDPAFERNRSALEAILPKEIPAALIDVIPGATWIPVEDYQDFIDEVIAPHSAPGTLKVDYNAHTGEWSLDGTFQGYDPMSLSNVRYWNSVTITRAVLNNTPITVTERAYRNGKETSVVNVEATASVQEFAETIRTGFSAWLWANDERAQRLQSAYNRRFNGIVARSYDDFAVTPIGLSATFHPHLHQLSAVARIINEPASLIAHVVGAGKTAEMVMAAMELRRLQISHKAAIVVPNHMLEQFTRESYQLYPNARILSIGSADVSSAKSATLRRRLVLEQAAANDWDMVILTYGAFQAIPVSPEVESEFIRAQLAELEAIQMAELLAKMKTDSSAANPESPTRIRMAKRRAKESERLQARLAAVTSKYDPTAPSFDRLGFDALFVDEAHLFKNTTLISSDRALARTGAQRSTDLQMKTDYLRGAYPTARIVFATATPLSNSMSEAYTMWRYLRPDLLSVAGITHFDAWLAQFGRTRQEVEMSPDGASFRVKSRYSQFVNLPELMHFMGTFMDVKTQDDLQLTVPQVHGGQSQIVAIPPSPALRRAMKWLVHRTELIGGHPGKGEDNLLSILGDGRNMTLSMKMMMNRPDYAEWAVRHPEDPYLEPEESSKLAVVAANIASVYAKHKDDRFDPTDTPGALQLVFMDYGTPGDGKAYVAYHDLRERLIHYGVPADEIRFMQDAKTDSAKAQLFQQANSGGVSVLIGSTESMGVGTNVQARAVAIHDVTCPWRPADLAQRMGRIVRQGNRYSEIYSFRYVVESSLDAFSWQTVERKARFIGAFMRRSLDVREMEDIGEDVLSFAQTKAVASGNKLLMELAGVDDELRKLSQKRKGFEFKKNDLERQRRNAREDISRYRRGRDIDDRLLSAYAETIDSPDEKFLRIMEWRSGLEIPERGTIEGVRSFLDTLGTNLTDPEYVRNLRLHTNGIGLHTEVRPHSGDCAYNDRMQFTLAAAYRRPGYMLTCSTLLDGVSLEVYVPVGALQAFGARARRAKGLGLEDVRPSESHDDEMANEGLVIDAGAILEGAPNAPEDDSTSSSLIEVLDHPLGEVYAKLVAGFAKIRVNRDKLARYIEEEEVRESEVEAQIASLTFDPEVEARINELLARKQVISEELAKQSKGSDEHVVEAVGHETYRESGGVDDGVLPRSHISPTPTDSEVTDATELDPTSSGWQVE